MKTQEEIRQYQRDWYNTPEGKTKRLQINERRRKRVLAWIDEQKSKVGCKYCGESHPAALDFHHIDPTTKSGSIASMAKDASIKRLTLEMSKCEIICANCHRKLHYEQRNLLN